MRERTKATGQQVRRDLVGGSRSAP